MVFSHDAQARDRRILHAAAALYLKMTHPRNTKRFHQNINILFPDSAALSDKRLASLLNK